MVNGQSPGAGQSPGVGQSPGGSPQPASPQPGYGSPASAAGPRSLWKEKAGDRNVFRHPVPLVLWWGWIAFALANFIDVAVVDGGLEILKVALGLLAVTGIFYATTLHSRVESDPDGATVFNPLRHHRVPWGAVEGIYLGDSVEFTCTRPAPKKAKTIYSWALYSRRRSRARSQMQREFFSTRRTQVSPRAPSEVSDLAKQATAQLMAAELGRQAVAARDRGAPGAFLQSRWSWWPIAAIIMPMVALIVALQFH
jgi:hypothetical protein